MVVGWKELLTFLVLSYKNVRLARLGWGLVVECFPSMYEALNSILPHPTQNISKGVQDPFVLEVSLHPVLVN